MIAIYKIHFTPLLTAVRRLLFACASLKLFMAIKQIRVAKYFILYDAMNLDFKTNTAQHLIASFDNQDASRSKLPP